MVFYFSATGNNKYIAEKIAEELDDVAVSIEIFEQKEIGIKEKESLGFVFPTYFLELPPNVVSFLNDATFVLPDDTYIFGVVTYGSTSGACGTHLKKLLRNKGVALAALYSIITPDTWTLTFDLSDSGKVGRTLDKTARQLNHTIDRIKAKKKGDFRTRQLPFFVTLFSDPVYQKARHTSHFHVEDNCIGCGLCEKNCPTKAIAIKNGRPIWIKEQCLICLRCLHSCPQFAIQYEDKTAGHGQYRYEKYGRM